MVIEATASFVNNLIREGYIIMKMIRQTGSVRGLQGAWIFGTVLALVVCFTAISGEAQSPPAQWKPGQTVVLRVGGSTPAQTTYQVVAAHKAIIEKHVTGVRMILRATSGGPDSMDMMRAGELEMSGNNSAAAYSAHHAAFKDKGKKPLPVYSFFPIYSLEWGAIVPSDSPIRTFRDVVENGSAWDLRGQALS